MSTEPDTTTPSPIEDEGWAIDLSTATKQDLDNYAQAMEFDNSILDHNLWMLFRELFEGWGVEHFKLINPRRRAALRTNLLQRGVFVPRHDSRSTLSDVLCQVVEQDEFHQWTDEELSAALEELNSPMITAMLRKRLNSTRDGLREHTQVAEGHPKPSAYPKSNPRARRNFPDPPASPEDCFATPKANPSTPGTNHLAPEIDHLAPESDHIAGESNHVLSMRPKNDISKEIASVMKIYTDDQKYSGTDNTSFDIKSSTSIPQRAAAIRKATTEIKKLRAEHQVADALNLRSGPSTTAVHDLSPISPVLVWREGNGGKTGSWTGLLTVLTTEGLHADSPEPLDTHPEPPDTHPEPPDAHPEPPDAHPEPILDAPHEPDCPIQTVNLSLKLYNLCNHPNEVQAAHASILCLQLSSCNLGAMPVFHNTMLQGKRKSMACLRKECSSS
jgi:hypothetical protein